MKKKVNRPFGFITENAQKTFDSIDFEIAYALFEKNQWHYGYGDDCHVPTVTDLKNTVRELLKDAEDYILEHGDPQDEGHYLFATGRWTILYWDYGDYDINLDFSNYQDWDDEDEEY